MKRKTFIQLTAAALSATLIPMKLKALTALADELPDTPLMPVVFIGHGNPMNAITDNPFSKAWNSIAQSLPVPKAIMVVSAHWLSRGTLVTMNPKPETIHDFGGFPDELFQAQYPAPGAVDFAQLTIDTIHEPVVKGAMDWGLDHGAWSVLMKMYPKANIPVYQLSMDMMQPISYHYTLGQQLAFLRSKGVLILASGNIVHNLSMIRWENDGKVFDWALAFDDFVKTNLENNNSQALINYQTLSKEANMAHPSNDHYLPLLYAAGLRNEKDSLHFYTDSFDMGSLSMRSFVLS